MVHREKGFCQREFLCVSQYLKGKKNETGGEKKRRRRNSYFHGISTIAVRIRGRTIQLLLGQDLLYHPRRTLAIAQRCIHIVGRVLREIRKPGELCASRDTACIPFATVSGGFPCLCVVWGIIEPVANNNPPQQERISALFAQAVSAKRAVDVPSTAERLSNGLTVVPLDR